MKIGQKRAGVWLSVVEALGSNLQHDQTKEEEGRGPGPGEEGEREKGTR